MSRDDITEKIKDAVQTVRADAKGVAWERVLIPLSAVAIVAITATAIVVIVLRA